MKTLTLFTLASALILGISSCPESGRSDNATADTSATTTTTAATTSTETSLPPMDSAEQMKAWMDYMTPGDPHKMMAAWDGKWKTESTMWMEPGAPPQTSTGTAVNKMILGGRYQRMTYSAEMMGEKMEGEGITAYDNASKEFVTTWIDNMGTGLMKMSGPWDGASKTINMKGDCVDPMTGKDMSMREVYRILDDTHHEMQLFRTVDGKEMKMMEMKMTKL